MATREHLDYEIILVDDYSSDGVFAEITSICKENNNIIGVNLSKNFGQHSALMAGFHFISGDIIICLDDDAQNPADELFSLVDVLNDGADLVFAKYSDKKHSIFRNFGSFINDIMACILIQKPKDIAISSYFACHRFVIDEVIKYSNSYPYMSGLLLRVTNNVKNVQVIHRERAQGSSGYTLKKLFSLWLNGFTAFSIKPLRIASVGGGIFAFIGFIYGVIIILNKIKNPTVPLGYSSTMAVVLFMCGLILLVLGMIGEYIGRIYISLNNAPQYVIRNTLNTEKNKSN